MKGPSFKRNVEDQSLKFIFLDITRYLLETMQIYVEIKKKFKKENIKYHKFRAERKNQIIFFYKNT